MRVISGKLKGRNIKGYDILGTRPTMDRVKESVFGMIQDYISNSLVLDLFAGSGSYGIECISNGAKMVYFNDKNKKCVNIIKDNLCNFNCVSSSIINNMDYIEALNFYQKENLKFDLIFLDPPYKENIIHKIIELIENKQLLNKNGLVVCELTTKEENSSNNLVLFKERRYGDKYILIYKKIN